MREDPSILDTQDDIYQSIRIAENFKSLVEALNKLGGIADSSRTYSVEELIYYIDGYIRTSNKKGITNYRSELALKAITETGGLRETVKRLIKEHLSTPKNSRL